MAIIITPSITDKLPALVTFDSAGISNQTCSLQIIFSLITGVSVNVAIALQIINLNQYRFTDNSFVLGTEQDNNVDGDQTTVIFSIKRITPVGVAGIPGCSIRVITWDKSSSQHSDKRVTSATFNV
jgi:hypothetical protein